MGVIYDWTGDTPKIQHDRLAALRQLTAHGIPCILWGEDALSFAHSVPTMLFDQQILVPDDSLEAAAIILEEGKYKRTSTPNRSYVERSGPHKGGYAFPRSIRLLHSDIPDEDPYQLEPIPQHILLLPQSYYGLDAARSAFRFQSLVPPLDSSNAGILVPKYNTFLEGLVEIIMNPPTGYCHKASKARHDVFIGYLTLYRIKPDLDLPEPADLRPIERDILSELQTEDCAWYMDIWLSKRDSVRTDAIDEYKRRKALRGRESKGKDSVVNSGFAGTQRPGLAQDTRSTYLVVCQRALQIISQSPLHIIQWLIHCNVLPAVFPFNLSAVGSPFAGIDIANPWAIPPGVRALALAFRLPPGTFALRSATHLPSCTPSTMSSLSKNTPVDPYSRHTHFPPYPMSSFIPSSQHSNAFAIVFISQRHRPVIDLTINHDIITRHTPSPV
ncbi:hypothetical protein Hypma_011931 [Hypsizygus marmoreus]|uniref:Uncharacterized protein n=1 Tax=Hypsizygus marmoreus TaxID=39966 RepID=A0A369JPD5_HYPMA|nr:hypothetical protein Hypma_011931 [Hypsizygus marmoreus]